MCNIQRLGFAAGKRLALVALGTQAFEDQLNRCVALLHRRFASVKNDHGPAVARTQRKRLYYGTLVRRGLIVKHLSLVPTFAGGSRCDQFERALGLGFVSCPTGSDRGPGIGCL